MRALCYGPTQIWGGLNPDVQYIAYLQGLGYNPPDARIRVELITLNNFL